MVSKKNYVRLREIYTMEESDIEKDPDLKTIQMAVMEEQNSAVMEDQVEFVKFDKVEFVHCCGMVYFLSIRVKGIVSQVESTIEKMVWKGMSMEVLDTNKKENIDSSSTTKKLSVGEFEIDFSSLVLRISGPDTNPLRLVRFHHFEENTERRLDRGWFRFKVYTLTVEAKPRDGNEAKVIIEASVLRREWLRTLDEEKAASFRAWKINMFKAQDPPRHRLRLRVGCNAQYYPIDMCSPQVVTQAWLALEDHNYKEGKKLEFVKVVKAEYSPASGEYYYLTFQAKDHGILTTFQVVVYYIAFMKGWKPVTLLKPCEMEDDYDEPEAWSKPSATYKPQRTRKPQRKVRSRK
ncbi:hypothetical protein ACHQM5_017991 [Ranunculus cassubicifolius]